MSQILAVSEAASIVMHAIILLAIAKASRSTHELAESLKVSENHCSKVMQRLTKAGLVTASRGPKGGFSLSRPPEEITLAEIYESIEGPLCPKHCLFKVQKCPASKCLFHNLTAEINRKVEDFLRNNSVADLITNSNIKY